ncbi:hypothetical protein HHK36_005007 [Tetracentron sinense]|uniref:DUF4283 domain-containing protein n=1 Tax=Tetracentron sinense TaxID=13715 RepID=A0A834ZUQ8_TETSI|nr:hypothetical protein HHK36_005007 [Tetracentron sinense]
MRIVSWNVRGLGRGERRLDVRVLLWKLKPDLIALQETKLEEMNDRVVSEMWDNRQANWEFVASMGASGGQLVMWDSLVYEKVEAFLGEFSISIRFRGVGDGFEWIFTSLKEIELRLNALDKKEVRRERPQIQGLRVEQLSREEMVEAKSFELVEVGTKEGLMVKLTEKNRRGALSFLWLPADAISWMDRMVKGCLKATGYLFRRFHGDGITILGEKRANGRGEYLLVQAYLGAGKGGRIFIPRGDRSRGWKALVDALLFFNPSLKSRSSKSAFRNKLDAPSPQQGLRSHVEKVDGINSIVVDLDAGGFRQWADAIVCSFGSSGPTASWVEVVELLEKLLPEEIEITLFPCDSSRAVFHLKRQSTFSRICNNKAFALGKGSVVGFHRWWPASNTISFTGQFGMRWIALKGIPFHLWVPSVFSQIGQICGGLIEIHPDTEGFKDLTMAKIRVRGDVRSIPRLIPLYFHSISYPIEVLIWEGEVCSSSSGSPEIFERRQRSGEDRTGGITAVPGGGVRTEADPKARALKPTVSFFPEEGLCIPKLSSELQGNAKCGDHSIGGAGPMGCVHGKPKSANPVLPNPCKSAKSTLDRAPPQARIEFKIQN